MSPVVRGGPSAEIFIQQHRFVTVCTIRIPLRNQTIWKTIFPNNLIATKMLPILVVSLMLHPSTGIGTENRFSRFVIAEDEDGERKSWQPPVELEGIHSETLVHARAVGQETSKGSLEEETKVHEPIEHSLLEHGKFPCLTDDKIRPLDNDN